MMTTGITNITFSTEMSISTFEIVLKMDDDPTLPGMPLYKRLLEIPRIDRVNYDGMFGPYISYVVNVSDIDNDVVAAEQAKRTSSEVEEMITAYLSEGTRKRKRR